MWTRYGDVTDNTPCRLHFCSCDNLVVYISETSGLQLSHTCGKFSVIYGKVSKYDFLKITKKGLNINMKKICYVKLTRGFFLIFIIIRKCLKRIKIKCYTL